ncbi:MAG: hypothetical protein KDB79_08745 [Acidobacteria bacterium]|nr:hypothetical protein [Acidobacteriota bacterium]
MTKFLFCIISILFFSAILPSNLCAQNPEESRSRSIELSDKEGIPVIIKHLPDWERKQAEAKFLKSKANLHEILGERPIFSTIDFADDTEAVTANYPAGKLLIVEYGTPQASSETDRVIKQYLADPARSSEAFYRRIGNYNVFILDANDQAAANALFDQIKYEKVVRWLNYDPFAENRAERAFIIETKSLFIGTVIAILTLLLFAIGVGMLAGLIFYQFRQRKRSEFTVFSDGGGLTRLNLDELTPEIIPPAFLKD